MQEQDYGFMVKKIFVRDIHRVGNQSKYAVSKRGVTGLT